MNQPGSTSSAVAKPSYRDVAPLEEGGRIARDGFAYQDHVTVGKCLDMLLVDGPSEVWCEAEDDIVLVWTNGGVEEFEFVQVKGHDLHQAWTVSKLCAREAGKGGKKKSSIVERSLAHDRGKEPCRFRIVTKWAPDEVLSILGTPPSARVDPEVPPLLATAVTAIEASLGACVSPNGNSVAFWVDRLEWEHRASIADVVNANLVKLHRVLDVEGESLAPDQSDVLLEALYAKVQDAAVAHAVTHKLDKRLLRNEVRGWLLDRAKQIQHPTHSGGAGPLVAKLTEAAIDDESIEVAKELRRRYVAEARLPKYLPADDRDALEGEILAALHALRVRLNSGACSDGGGEFLSRCQDELRRIRDTMTGPRPPDAVLYGCMYEVMNRCLHRLVRVRP
ncbi:MAG TPA: dsDNA nuclease domain-containing protein [Polyangiaceae bacterium]|nr:dsDNA nuclease domain-containing protein [Polyangiaceae bacterium]